MDFGMPFLLEMETLRDNVKLCRELRLNFVELNMNMPECQIGKLNASELRSYMNDSGIYFTLHTADDMNMTDFNLSVAEAHASTVVSAIDLAGKIDIPIINMHLNTGTYVTLPNERVFLFSKYIDCYMERITEFKKKCEQAATGTKVKICIENMDGHKDFAVRATEYLLESDIFALTLDTGHSFCANGVDEPLYEKHINKLRHMHLHDAIGSSPHLALGTGEIDLYEKLKLADRHDCRVVIETKTVASLKESVGWLRLNKYIPA